MEGFVFVIYNIHTITLYFLITDEEFKNETLAIDFHIYGSPDRGTLAIIHEPEAN